MKKYLIAILFIMVSNYVFSQNFKIQVGESNQAISNPETVNNPDIWKHRGKLFLDIAVAPYELIYAGMPFNPIALFKNDLKLISKSSDTLRDEVYGVYTYENIKLYVFDDIIQIFEVTKYDSPNPFQESYNALAKSYELDNLELYSDSIKLLLIDLSNQLKMNGINKYALGKIDQASDLLKLSLKCTSHPLINQTDTTVMYYLGVFAYRMNNYDEAFKYFEDCFEF